MDPASSARTTLFKGRTNFEFHTPSATVDTIMKIFASRWTGIETDAVLRLYVWGIVGGHVSAWLFIYSTGILASLQQGAEPFCWPYFEDCWKYRFASPSGISAALFLYGALIAAAAWCAIERRFNGCWFALLAASLWVAALTSLDYRLRGNQFYMLLWLNVVFLLAPSRRSTIPLTIVSFYVWAGVLKLNHEWLSGAVLYHDLWLIPREVRWLACVYVVLLEPVLIWGLLSRRRFVRNVVLAQLALFHLQSLSQIHWFYPLLMATVLSWFWLDRAASTASPVSLRALFTMKAPRAAYGMFVVFAAFQLVPYAYDGDADLTGQGRVFALHMFEARQVCDVTATLTRVNGTTTAQDLKLHRLPARVICDPVVYFNRAQNICRNRNALGVVDLRLTMRSKRTTDTAFTTIIDQPMFCAGRFSYAVLGENAWMRAPDVPMSRAPGNPQ
jgi:hypothetical protein